MIKGNDTSRLLIEMSRCGGRVWNNDEAVGQQDGLRKICCLPSRCTCIKRQQTLKGKRTVLFVGGVTSLRWIQIKLQISDWY